MEEDSSQFNLSCSNLSISELTSMNLSRGAAAAVCAAIMVTMLMVLCCSKAFVSVIQRLFLYLVMATIASELCQVATLEHQYVYPYQNEVCAVLGFLTHWSSTAVILFALGVILYILLLVCVNTRWTSLKFENLSTRARIFLECLYVVTIVLLPLTYIWVPFWNGNYGLAVAWCWIKSVDGNCNVTGMIDQMVVGYIMYVVVGLVGVVTMIGVTVAYCRLSTAEIVHIRKLLLQSLVLTSFVLLYVLFIGAAVAVRIYAGLTKSTQHFYMWIIQGMNMPICFLIIPFGFFGSFYFTHYRNKCCKRRRDQYDRLQAPDATVPASTRVTAPSNTYFKVPYTNGFTTVRSDFDTTP